MPSSEPDAGGLDIADQKWQSEYGLKHQTATKHSVQPGRSPFLMGKSSTTGPCSSVFHVAKSEITGGFPVPSCPNHPMGIKSPLSPALRGWPTPCSAPGHMRTSNDNK